MSHYDDTRVSQWAQEESENVTEEDRKRLLKEALKAGGKLYLFTESPDWPWPIVYRMLNDGDKRIFFVPDGGGYKIATVEANIDSKKERTKILLS